MVVSEDGSLMAPWVCRAALERSVGKIFYHAGFEDFQPSALDAMTDIASNFFTKLIDTFSTYTQLPRSQADNKPKYTMEEQVLHALFENGLDLDSLESYVKEDMDRQGTKLGVVHERLKGYFADIFVSISLPFFIHPTDHYAAASTWRQCRYGRCWCLQRWFRAVCGR